MATSRKARYLCSFGSYSVFGMNGISFRSFCSRQQSGQNERNTVYSEKTEYAFFWEIFGGKSYAAADIVVVLRSPPPWVFRFQKNVLFEIEIPCILLFLNWNKNSPKRMHP